jgi:GR25 family glycosyltransferase involved in LPS biosynthesis
VYDYIYVLRQCLTETDAPYVAIFEDDIIFAEGWLAKTLNGLAGLRELSESWLYLRLFYTETSLGWEASSDFWYGHQLLTFTLAMVAALTLLLGAKSTIRSLSRRLDNQMLVILVFIVTPAFTALIFMVGKYNLRPLQGLERMDKHGCCTQALVFPRFQVDDLIDFLYERGSGQTDSLIEEYADLQSYERYALAPQVVQHVGLVSSRNNLAINTKSTWAFWFEAQDARKLRKEHRQMARLGIWRASGDGS